MFAAPVDKKCDEQGISDDKKQQATPQTKQQQTEDEQYQPRQRKQNIEAPIDDKAATLQIIAEQWRQPAAIGRSRYKIVHRFEPGQCRV